MSLDNTTGMVFAAAPPPGVWPDPNRPVDLTDFVVPSAVSFALMVITSGIRIYTRAFLTRSLSMDDYIMVAAVVWATVLMAVGLNNTRWGMGQDIWDVPLEPNIFPMFSLDRIIGSVAFCLATGFAKGSILLFYLRIFPTRRMKYTVWILFSFTVGYSVASAFVVIFSCIPVEGSWRLEQAATARCINRGYFYYTQAALGVFTDVATFVMPLPMLNTIRLPFRQRIGAGFVLTVGAFVCIISVVRFKALFDLAGDSNITQKTKPALLWCNLELNFSIIGGNFPTLRPFNRSLFHPVRSTSGTGCRCWSQHFARRERTLRARRSGAVVRSLDAGASLGDLDFGSATAASSLPRDRTGRGSGERILMAGREQHRARKQERQPQVDEAGVNGPWEQTETRGSAKPNGLDCHENSKAVQNQP